MMVGAGTIQQTDHASPTLGSGPTPPQKNRPPEKQARPLIALSCCHFYNTYIHDNLHT